MIHSATSSAPDIFVLEAAGELFFPETQKKARAGWRGPTFQLYLFRVYGLVRVDGGQLLLQLLLRLLQLAVLIDEHADHHEQDRQGDQVEPAPPQAGMLQNECQRFSAFLSNSVLPIPRFRGGWGWMFYA